MSEREVDRWKILQQVEEKRITLVSATRLIGVGYRQTKRIWACYKNLGKAGLVSKKRGKSSHHKIPATLEKEIENLLLQRYYDFGPTFASEKLWEEYHIKVSKEKVRQLRIRLGIHKSKKQKEIRVYQRRRPRDCEGELIQLDGSPHDWFEGRGPKCTLLLAIDDATKKIKAARFELEETTNGYFRLMEDYLKQHGLPRALYTDRYSVFRINHGKNRSKKTQLARALEELDIELICARSPQAKGRVERTNGVLQDRLVKELRLNNISTIEEANAFLARFIEAYNNRFGRSALNSFNAHRPLKQSIDLKRIFCEKHVRKISKQLEVQYCGHILQIQAPGRERSLRKQGVTILEHTNGDVEIEYKGELLKYKYFKQERFQPPIVDHKQLANAWERGCAWRFKKPSRYHPWRKMPINPKKRSFYSSSSRL